MRSSDRHTQQSDSSFFLLVFLCFVFFSYWTRHGGLGGRPLMAFGRDKKKLQTKTKRDSSAIRRVFFSFVFDWGFVFRMYRLGPQRRRWIPTHSTTNARVPSVLLLLFFSLFFFFVFHDARRRSQRQSNRRHTHGYPNEHRSVSTG